MTAPTVLELDGRPGRLGGWAREVWAHRHVLRVLAVSDFHVRYKRAAFGILWAVAVPLSQAAVLAVVFSRMVRVEIAGSSYAAYVLIGMAAWGYVVATVPVAATAIVDGSGLTDKVWFPRALLPLVPVLNGTVGFGITLALASGAQLLVGGQLSAMALLLVPATVLLLAFVAALTLLLAGAYVYFRDVKYLVQAGIVLWFYLTPVAYPRSAVGDLGQWLDLNPLTGIVELFHVAVGAGDGSLARPLSVSVATTVVLLVAGVELHRRRDRLFVDLL